MAWPTPLFEPGFPASNHASVLGLFAQSGTPVEVLDRLNALDNEVLVRPAVRGRLLAVSNLPTGRAREALVWEIAT